MFFVSQWYSMIRKEIAKDFKTKTRNRAFRPRKNRKRSKTFAWPPAVLSISTTKTKAAIWSLWLQIYIQLYCLPTCYRYFLYWLECPRKPPAVLSLRKSKFLDALAVLSMHKTKIYTLFEVCDFKPILIESAAIIIPTEMTIFHEWPEKATLSMISIQPIFSRWRQLIGLIYLPGKNASVLSLILWNIARKIKDWW